VDDTLNNPTHRIGGRRALRLVFLACLASLVAGCGIHAEFIPPEKTRDALHRGFYTTFRLRYRTETTGFLGGLFSSGEIDRPRLLYAEKETDPENDPDAFRDTGAPFDPKEKTVAWRIPNVRELYGKTLTFALQGDNLASIPTLSVPFPRPGRILAVEPETAGRTVTFEVSHTGKVYNLEFYLLASGGRKRKIHPVDRGTTGEGVRVFAWDPARDLEPEASRIPLTFLVEYENWYFEKAEKPCLTSTVSLDRFLVFEPAVHGPGSVVRIPFRMWGKSAHLAFAYKTDGDWKTARHARVEENGGGRPGQAVLWNLVAEGLAPLTGPVLLRATTLGQEAGTVQVLPPEPGLAVRSHRQKGNVIQILFEASHVRPDAVRVFAGSGRDQRLLSPERIVQRTEGLVAFRYDGLPLLEGPDGRKRLVTVLAAANDAGQSEVETVIPLVRVEIQAVRQTDDTIGVRASLSPRKPPVLSYRRDPEGAFRRAERVRIEDGEIRWAFLEELGAPPEGEIELKVEIGDETASGEDTARIAPLHVAFRDPRALGKGLFEIPVAVKGRPDWVRFAFGAGGRGDRPALGAVFDASAGCIRWAVWRDVNRETYGGEELVLRAAFRNRWGFFTAVIPGLRPSFLRLGEPERSGKTVRIPLRARRDMDLAFFVSTDGGESWRSLAGGRVEDGVLAFDLGDLGPLSGNAVQVRARATAPGGAREEDAAVVRLPAGIDPSGAYWHRGTLWVKYEVDWNVPEKDVEAEFYAETPEARPPRWRKASVDSWVVYDVNRRGLAWDVARDLARSGVDDRRRLHLRLVIRGRDASEIVRHVSLVDLPPPPLALRDPALGFEKGHLVFSVGSVTTPAGEPPFSSEAYDVQAWFLDPRDLRFRAALPVRRLTGDGAFAWKRGQSLQAVRAGTWVKLVVTRKGDNRVTGFALFDVHLPKDHAFFRWDEEGF